MVSMEPMISGPVVRRPATAAEAKALAHPLRMRILRLCLDRSLTNKQLADWLGKDPGTVLHHVRTLVKSGFLVPDEVRQGEKGALEKPYRATGKSWTLSLEESPVPEGIDAQAMLEAFRAELAEAATAPTAAMCSETLWWRCHRRLLSDAAVLVRRAEVLHLDHRGGQEPHRPTEGVRRDGDLLAYDLGATPPLPGS